MGNISDRHREAYREEAIDLLNELEDALLELEEDQSNTDLVSRVFRALHTIKGSGAMFGFESIAAFTHDIENAFDLVRNGKTTVSDELINLTLRARDHIRHLLMEEEIDDSEAANGRDILSSIEALIPPEERRETPEAEVPEAAGKKALAAGLRTFRITFTPEPGILRMGANPLYLLDDLRALGQCHVMARMDRLPDLDSISPDDCYLSWEIFLITGKGEGDIHEVFMFVEDSADVKIELIDSGGELTEEEDAKKLGEILVSKGAITQQDIDSVISRRRLLGQVLVDEGMVDYQDVDSALMEQSLINEARKERREMDLATTVKVPVTKLDRLVNLVGEMVTTQARLTQIAGGRKDPVLNSIAEEVERLTSELHDSSMNIRMVPIGSTFGRFRRLVRDLSAELGREINLRMEGAETELDKTVIDRLNDPLVHLIRNAVDHGIESPETRRTAGKDPRGNITISALHSGADVLIKIQDDGAGLDYKAIRRKALDKGMISADDSLSDEDVFNLIFLPGFTTARKVTNISGRGVGMDVVKRSIESLRGTVEGVSRKGMGTTVTLRIPLTLAIIDGLLVRVGRSFFIMPLASVDECVELLGEDRRESAGRRLVEVRGELIPYISLREKFSVNSQRPEMEQIVIIKQDNMTVGFAVDQVMGGHQTVIKSLSKVYRNVRSIAGATILGDGSVALILDLQRLVEDSVELVQETAQQGPSLT